MFKVFGIRHHGPGSAKSLIEALNDYGPDCLLIEAPADINNKLLAGATIQQLTPPVAILVYNPKNFAQSIYLPFTDFSPEWQAIQYALHQQIDIELIDLPYANQLYFEQEEAWQNKLQLHTSTDEISRDPFGYLARLAGYQDKERWWEATFELTPHEKDIFDTITEMIKELRLANQHQESPLNLLREAFMRKQMRKAIKTGYQKIAVVCGAWHAPTLAEVASYKVQRDNALLKGMKKVKSESCWIPWSYPNLAKKYGYGAGVHSPTWYELLYKHQQQAPIVLLSQAAKLLRKEGFSISPADITQAVRLANTLASMRHKTIPALEEFREAILTVLCQGSQEKLTLIEDLLFIGQTIGKVNASPSLPLAKDILQTIKTARLTKYWEKSGTFWLKATATNPQGGLDLRNESDRLKSVLLHRLKIINIHWGKTHANASNSIGSFREVWQLEWEPSFSIRIIEAAIWGNSLEMAAANALLDLAKKSTQLQQLTPLLELALNAQLHTVFDELLLLFQHQVADTSLVLHLMESLPPLARIAQFGDVRQTNTILVEALLSQLIPRITLGLVSACIQLKEEDAQQLAKTIKQTNSTLTLLNNSTHFTLWYKALTSLVATANVHPMIQGLATRILYDKKHWDINKTTQQINLALSISNKVIDMAYWLEGFLDKNGLLLIKQPQLWQLIDNWVDQLSPQRFEESLPVLRRAFASFLNHEKQKIILLAQQQQQPQSLPNINNNNTPWQEERKSIIDQQLKVLLG